jgi:hypothetical protein
VRDHRSRTIVFFLVLCSASPLTRASIASDEPLSVSFCDMLATPQRFDQKTVATEAFIRSSEHEVDAYDSKCRSTVISDPTASVEFPSGWNSTKLGKRLSRILRHDRTAKVGF